MPFRAFHYKKKQLGILSKDEFFRALAAKAGYMEETTVQRVYNALLDLIYDEVFRKGAIILPAFARVYMFKRAARKIQSVYMGEPIYKAEHYVMKMAPEPIVRRYIRKILDSGQFDGFELDPGIRAKQMGPPPPELLNRLAGTQKKKTWGPQEPGV